MHQGKPHFKVYSSPASQWAGVPLLGLIEAGYPEGEFEVEDVDLSKQIPPPPLMLEDSCAYSFPHSGRWQFPS
jgi:hypothetical protein